MPWCTAASLRLPVAASIQLVPSHSCTKFVATRVLHESLVLKKGERGDIMSKMQLSRVRWPGNRFFSEL